MSKNSKRKNKVARTKKATRWVAHYHGQVVKVKATGIVGWAMAGGKDKLRIFCHDREVGDICHYNQRNRIIEVPLAKATILRLKGELPNPPPSTKTSHDFERLQRFLEKHEKLQAGN